MKKLLSILNIAEANECRDLETDYKVQRKNLKRYQESLKIFRVRLAQNVHQMQITYKNVFTMHQSQSKSRKKNSEVEYYMYNGVKVFGSMIAMFNSAALYYEDLYKRVLTIEAKISKCLAEQKKKFQKNCQQHEKQIKTLASECYPQTNSILFMIGLVSTEKIAKKSDSFREMSAIQESKRYSSFLNLCLDQMEELKKEVMLIGEDFYSGAKEMWIQGAESFKETLEGFEVNQEEVNKIAEQTGRVLTDRSAKSNEDSQQPGQICENEQQQQDEPNEENIQIDANEEVINQAQS